MHLRLPVLAVLLVPALAACGADGATDARPEPAPASVRSAGGDNQQALIFTAVPEPLRVRVADAGGNPVAGATVKWSASAGTLSPWESRTDASGVASTAWTFRDETQTFRTGAHQATAEVGRLAPVTFTAHARVGVEVRGLTLNPGTVNVAAGAASVDVRIHATDDFAAVDRVLITFASPSRGATATNAALVLASGTARDGVWQGTVQIPQGAEPGTWRVSSLTLRSTAGTAITANASSLEYRGLTSGLTVTGP